METLRGANILGGLIRCKYAEQHESFGCEYNLLIKHGRHSTTTMEVIIDLQQ